MSVEQNKATIRRVVEEVFNKRNMSVIPELIAPGYVYRSPMGIDFKGPAGFAQFVGMMHSAFPDLHMAVDDMFGDGEKLAARLSMRGTFTGDLGPMKATGKKFNQPFAFFYRFEGGKELEAVEYGDMLSFYQQMGVKPPGW